ncbi:hypothetical protein ACTXT7_010411 [Hymenolepis weldensis]
MVELEEFNPAIIKTFVRKVPENPLKESKWIQHLKVMMKNFAVRYWRGIRVLSVGPGRLEYG